MTLFLWLDLTVSIFGSFSVNLTTLQNFLLICFAISWTVFHIILSKLTRFAQFLLFFTFQCEGQLDWKEVGNETRTVNITLPTENIYQFAVAANTLEYSSGMVWATCTILHNKGSCFCDIYSSSSGGGH